MLEIYFVFILRICMNLQVFGFIHSIVSKKTSLDAPHEVRDKDQAGNLGKIRIS